MQQPLVCSRINIQGCIQKRTLQLIKPFSEYFIFGQQLPCVTETLINILLLYPGEILLEGLQYLSNIYPHQIGNVRGRGMFCAFDCRSTEKRDQMVEMLKNRGIQSGVSGKTSIRLRPHLVFQAEHANIFLETLELTLNEIAPLRKISPMEPMV